MVQSSVPVSEENFGGYADQRWEICLVQCLYCVSAYHSFGRNEQLHAPPLRSHYGINYLGLINSRILRANGDGTSYDVGSTTVRTNLADTS